MASETVQLVRTFEHYVPSEPCSYCGQSFKSGDTAGLTLGNYYVHMSCRADRAD